MSKCKAASLVPTQLVPYSLADAFPKHLSVGMELRNKVLALRL